MLLWILNRALARGQGAHTDILPLDMRAETQPLLDFIEAIKSQGASDEFVVALLRQNGWPEKRIYQAFGSSGTLFYFSHTSCAATWARDLY